MDQCIQNIRFRKVNREPFPSCNQNNVSSDEEKSGALSSSYYDSVYTQSSSLERSRNSLRIRLNERRIYNRYEEKDADTSFSFNYKPVEHGKKSKPVSLLSSLEEYGFEQLSKIRENSKGNTNKSIISEKRCLSLPRVIKAVHKDSIIASPMEEPKKELACSYNRRVQILYDNMSHIKHINKITKKKISRSIIGLELDKNNLLKLIKVKCGL